MRETEKLLKSPPALLQTLGGPILDIGGAPCPYPGAEVYDKEQGDAQTLSPPPQLLSYGTVYSSHCLEHLERPLQALARWWEFVRYGGYLVLLLPDYWLHEHGQWPSKNLKHKVSFSMQNMPVLRWNHYRLSDLQDVLDNSVLKLAEWRDSGYDYYILKDSSVDQSMGAAEVSFLTVFWKHRL